MHPQRGGGVLGGAEWWQVDRKRGGKGGKENEMNGGTNSHLGCDISKYKTLSQMTEIICIHFVQFVRCRKICTFVCGTLWVVGQPKWGCCRVFGRESHMAILYVGYILCVWPSPQLTHPILSICQNVCSNSFYWIKKDILFSWCREGNATGPLRRVKSQRTLLKS